MVFAAMTTFAPSIAARNAMARPILFFPNVKKIKCSDANFTECFSNLINSYKFYIAFENSLCDDYITEKYWKFYTNTMMFKINILPVVRGAKRNQYELVTNMSSLVFADDFGVQVLCARLPLEEVRIDQLFLPVELARVDKADQLAEEFLEGRQ